MTFNRLVSTLSTFVNRDDAGRHFTHVYTDETIGYLEDNGWITIDRPTHRPTGIEYDSAFWYAEVSARGVELVECCSVG